MDNPTITEDQLKNTVKNLIVENPKIIISSEQLKSAFKAVLKEEPELLKQLVREILAEEGMIALEEEKSERQQKLESFIKEDFEKYDTVFRNLAK